MRIFNFDQIDTWEPLFDAAMREIADEAALAQARAASPEFLEDARDFFVDRLGVEALTSGLNRGLADVHVKVFHGTRLTEDETENVTRRGLTPLSLIERRQAMVAIFQDHPRWSEVEGQLDAALRRFGPDWRTGGGGRREDGCVHVCLSRAGLLLGCNHYLEYGAEVDDIVASALFGDDTARALLKAARRPKLISFSAPWSEASQAASPYGFNDQDVPALMDQFLKAWAFRLANPLYQPSRERTGMALRFEGVVTPDRLTIEYLTDTDLEE